MVPTPRMRTAVFSPGAPVACVMATPAALPCIIWATLVTGMLAMSRWSICDTATVTSDFFWVV
jgi:hypothetical protein